MDTELYQIYRKYFARKHGVRCQFVDSVGQRCESSAISSHTVQKSRTLGSIAENGHVTSINYSGFKEKNRIGFETIGVRKASIFPGFCSDHDHALFSSVETGIGDVSEEERVLLSFRSVCHELYKKETIISAFTDADFRALAEKKGSLGVIDTHLLGCTRACKDLLRSKASHLSYFHEKQGVFNSVLFHFSEILPFAYSSAFAPEYDMQGNSILPSEEKEWGSVSYFAGKTKGSSVLLFSGFDDVAHHPVSAFINSLASLSDTKVGGFALQVGIEFAENLFFKTSWVNALLPEIKVELVARFSAGVPGMQSLKKKELARQFDIVRINGGIQQT